jgi:hypothetical protein
VMRLATEAPFEALRQRPGRRARVRGAVPISLRSALHASHAHAGYLRRGSGATQHRHSRVHAAGNPLGLHPSAGCERRWSCVRTSASLEARGRSLIRRSIDRTPATLLA